MKTHVSLILLAAYIWFVARLRQSRAGTSRSKTDAATNAPAGSTKGATKAPRAAAERRMYS